ncbi:40-residue YVTN family beta-propeller repeat-containing protein [Fimbriimonas ginsengisoli Gsoil 348]|uniref:40-residue YVTN family beta-propeller repeat-containing protein n=1 Tax=Fimbriimonas ginsengisoli Gsoil 348 TaxID=661478 RepID=A0A068NK35_FIMGI|nr:40-residue YVTN family beta-propeller repeat-containing protein [Fimbriimonas ginsengisoli Gsoil 348]
MPGDMPANILFVDGGRKALVNTCGFHDHSLNLVDIERGVVTQTQDFDRSWMGLTKVGDSILVSGGSVENASKREAIHQVRLAGWRLERMDGISLPSRIAGKDQFVSALLAGPHGIYTINIQTDEVMLMTPAGVAGPSVTVGYRPYAAVLSPDGNDLAVSNWGDRSVWILDAQSLAVKQKIAVQSHPTGLAYAADGRLFVTNAGSNTVSVVESGRVKETVRTGVDPTNKLGATPVAIALAPDGKRAYVANAGDNCVAVLDISRRGATRLTGFIPTERYPTAVAVTPNGKRLLVATAKGFYGPNAGPGVDLEGPGVRGQDYKDLFRYIGNQMAGRLAIVDVPGDKKLAEYSRQVFENSPAGAAAAATARERKKIEQGAFSKIKHVIYVIRENRTYDQVLGDLAKGNGDPHLTIFGENVTPNGHKIANTFTLFDNLYTNGDVSQTGHQWTDAAYANDYAEKQWMLNYSRKGEVRSDTRLTSSPGEYLWTLARKKGLFARVYGEYVSMQEDHGSAEDPELKRDPEKFGFSATFEKIFARDGRDTEKVADFLNEMHVAERTGKWPALMVMALPEDHTHGFSAGQYSPYAMIANNDWAIGQLIDAVSHSPFWKNTAIFIIQDDAQDGPDHVDSHRTVGYVVSPYVRRGAVDHTMYSTASMLRTMELMLGLPPMTEYDAKATPMHAAFTVSPNFSPFTVEPPRVSVDERNPSRTALARRSSKLDFSDIDRADFDQLNRLLWDGYRPGQPYPGTHHAR